MKNKKKYIFKINESNLMWNCESLYRWISFENFTQAVASDKILYNPIHTNHNYITYGTYGFICCGMCLLDEFLYHCFIHSVPMNWTHLGAVGWFWRKFVDVCSLIKITNTKKFVSVDLQV